MFAQKMHYMMYLDSTISNSQMLKTTSCIMAHTHMQRASNRGAKPPYKNVMPCTITSRFARFELVAVKVSRASLFGEGAKTSST